MTEAKPTEVKVHRANQVRQEVRHRIDVENPVSFQNKMNCADSFTSQNRQKETIIYTAFSPIVETHKKNKNNEKYQNQHNLSKPKNHGTPLLKCSRWGMTRYVMEEQLIGLYMIWKLVGWTLFTLSSQVI